VDDVLNGSLDGFIEAYLLMSADRRKSDDESGPQTG
jgi:hypothetical protein